MFKPKLFSSMIVVLCLFSVSAEAQPAPATRRGTRVQSASAAAPAAAAQPRTARGTRINPNIDEGASEIPYVTCTSNDPRTNVNLWLGDYQGKQSAKLSGRSVQSYAKGIHAPTRITATKSADGKTCNLSFINKNNQALRFNFEMRNGPLHMKRVMPENSRYTMLCTGYENSSFAALSRCTVPAIRTKQTMPASCRPEEPTNAELAYTCQVTGNYLQKSASQYSMRYCDAGPRGSEARVDKVCVAKASCTRRPSASQAAFNATRSWPNVFPTYVVCRQGIDGRCGQSADDCRSDKTLYFTNEQRGESLIRVDVGLDMPSSAAPAAPVARTTDVWRTTPLPEPPAPAPRANQPSAVVVDENGDWAAPAPAGSNRVRTQVVPSNGAQ